MEFKDRIKSLRDDKGLSPSKLGAAMDKSEGAVRSWETGKAKPDADTLIRLAKYFDCSTDYLLGLDDNKNKETLHSLNESLMELQKALAHAEKKDEIINAITCILLSAKDLTGSEIKEGYIYQLLSSVLHVVLTNLSMSGTYAAKLLSRDIIDAVSFSSFFRSLKGLSLTSEDFIKVYFTFLMRTVANKAIEHADPETTSIIENLQKTFIEQVRVDETRDYHLKTFLSELEKIP